MAKLHPKRYGDKLIATDEAKDEPVKIQWITTGVPRDGDDATVSDLMKTIDGRTRTIEREIIAPLHDDDGNVIGANDTRAMRKRIIELEERLGMREAPPEPPKLLTYDPGPLPKNLDPDVLVRLVDTFKRSLPQDDQRPPETVLDEATSIIERALRSHYGTSEAA
jgi:hypothetical protein